MSKLLCKCIELDMDLETTGLDIEIDRPWQIAMMPDVFICNPGKEINAEARKICHIDDALLARILAAPSIREALETFVIPKLTRIDAIVAYNGVMYDGPLLQAILKAEGFLMELPPIIDPKIWAIEIWPNLHNHKLTTVYQMIDGSIDDFTAHDARGDCGMMRKIWNEIQSFKILERRSLDTILRFQTRAKMIQDKDWESYKGTTPDGAIFLWLRTCCSCVIPGTGKGPNNETCSQCKGYGVLNQTKKRRGMPLDPGFCRWTLNNVELPPEVRRIFEEIA